MRNVFATLSRDVRLSDLSTAADVSLAVGQPPSRTRKHTRNPGGTISSLSAVFRPSSSTSPGATRHRHFPSSIMAATLVGFAGNPLAVEVTGALLRERLSRSRDEDFSDAQEPLANVGIRISVGDRSLSPTPPDVAFHLELDDRGHAGREELDKVELNQGAPHNQHPGPASVPKFEDNSGWVMISQAPSSDDPPSALLDSTRSLGAVPSPSPLGSPGVYSRDFAYLSSSSLGSLAAQAQAQAPLRPSASNTSFVTALTSMTGDRSPRSSVASKIPLAVGNVCESPNAMQSFKRPVSIRRPSSLRVSTGTDTGGELGNAISRLIEEHGRQAFGHPSAVTEEASESAQADHRDSTRRALIIGNSYRMGTRRTHTMYSITTPQGAENDISLLKGVFEGRGYVVEGFNQDGFHRRDVLDRVVAFLRDAKPGHIRAIAFIGHACAEPDGSIVLVPPHCPTPNMAIPQADWENAIRTKAMTGSIVFSVMAHCFSGDFMKQKQDCRTWKPPEPGLHPHLALEKPVFITFASSTKSQPSFESTIEREDPEKAQDHFLYALAMTIKIVEVQTWEAFFVAFKHYFDRARSGASWAERFDLEKHLAEGGMSERFPTWRPASHQDPSFSASEILGYTNMFTLPVAVS